MGLIVFAISPGSSKINLLLSFSASLSFISLSCHPPSSFLSSSSEDAGKSSLTAQKALPLWSGPTLVIGFMGLPWQQASLATHQDARTNWKELSFSWDILHLFSAVCPESVPYYGRGKERKKYQGFYIFLVCSLWGRTTNCSQKQTFCF